MTLDAAAFEARFNMPLVHETVRAELNARRRGTASTKTRGKVRGGGAKPWRQKGTGRAAPARSALAASGPAAASSSAPPRATTPSRSTARRAGPRCAAPCRCTPSASRWPCSTPRVFDAPSTSQAAELLDDWGAAGPMLVAARPPTRRAAGKSFRNIARVEVMPVGDAGVADVIGAASLLVSEAALPALVARASGGARDGGGEEEA